MQLVTVGHEIVANFANRLSLHHYWSQINLFAYVTIHGVIQKWWTARYSCVDERSR